jgi:hypothetical protein
LVRLVQPAKVNFPMLVTPLPIVTLLGIVTLVTFVRDANDESPTLATTGH